MTLASFVGEGLIELFHLRRNSFDKYQISIRLFLVMALFIEI